MWEVSKVELTLTEGDNDYSINAYDIDILDAYIQRTVNGVVTDYTLDRVDRNEYVGIPNKATKARPTEFWLERLKTPVIHLYHHTKHTQPVSYTHLTLPTIYSV